MPHTLGPSPRLFWVKLLLGQCVQIARLGACFSIKMYDCHRSELLPGKNPGLNVGNIRLQFSCWDVPSSFASQRLPLGNTQQPKSSCLTLRMRILPCVQSLDDLIHGTSFTAWLLLWRKYVRSSTQWVELALRVQQLPLVAWSRLYRNMYGTTIEGTHSSLQFMLPPTPLQSLQLLRLPLHGYLIPRPPLTHFGKKNNSTKKTLPYLAHLQISAGLQEHTCCAVWLSFSDHRLLTKSGGRAILSGALHRTMNFLHHLNVSVECLSDSLQQILKYDNGPQKWLMVSSSWFHFPDPLHPLACVPRLIRIQGFSLISWWVSCSALSQICRHRYVSQPLSKLTPLPSFSSSFSFFFFEHSALSLQV